LDRADSLESTCYGLPLQKKSVKTWTTHHMMARM
jgi:hypothetical protein